MHIHLSGNGSHAMFLLALLFILAVLRLSLRRKFPHNHKRTSLRFRFTGAVIGNALQAIHAFVDPGVRYVIAEKLEEPSQDDGGEDPADPAIHFERQLRRIRHGEEIDRLTIRIKKHE
jgi:hypothetical protein